MTIEFEGLSWDYLENRDIVYMSRGEDEFFQGEVVVSENSVEAGGISIWYFQEGGWSLDSVYREDIKLTDHTGSLAFTNRGLAIKQGDWWVVENDALANHTENDLRKPKAALPVPAENLLRLFDISADISTDMQTIYKELNSFRFYTLDEWDRSGIKVKDD